MIARLQLLFNPIAPRKAKIVCNFGLSGCNRVRKQISYKSDLLSNISLTEVSCKVDHITSSEHE